PRVLAAVQSDYRIRHLHSFPTRRSSDLVGRAGYSREVAFDLRVSAQPILVVLFLPCCRPRLVRDLVAFHHAQPGGNSSKEERERSEEHTSELQSRVDLVCRLLLEKKNKA